MLANKRPPPNPPQAQPLQNAMPPNQQTQQQQQQIAAWNYYHEQQQRAAIIQQNSSNYYQHLPPVRQGFHGHKEATVFQNCQSIAMEQHYGRTYARSPTRRPESPPPMRNYNQTMFLIPCNTETYATHFTTNEQIPGQYRRGVMEYKQLNV